MAVIVTRHLTKKYKDLVAVDAVDLEVNEGECFGLLGPNGAGKTSLIRMITAVSPPTSGDIHVLGKDIKASPREVKAVLGVVPQEDNLDEDLTVQQNLVTFARYFSIPTDEARRRSLEVLDLFQLQAKRNVQIRELSGGMRRRLLIARGLINNPRVMILDEPTVGLDPQARHLVWRKLAELKTQGITNILCTQNMEEATVLCDRVAVMHQARILTMDTPKALIARYVGEEVLEIDYAPGGAGQITSRLANDGLDFVDDGLTIQVFNVSRDKQPADLAAFSAGFRRRRATLEDVFFKLTGRALV